ncbi:MAG: hypothetical protein IKR19_07745 [Acholeplasmatales bacterium]|nr:hypothetical protein [Acholeplasmatales bacterium]
MNDGTQISTTTDTGNDIDVNNGNLNMLGMQIKISDIIGEKIVDQFMASITPEQMDAITKVLFDEIFENITKSEYDHESQQYKNHISTVFKTTTYRKNYYGRTEEEETTLYKAARDTLISKYSKVISQKIEEYINSNEYKAKAESIAKDIMDYATEGYKKDIIEGIRKRLVLPVVYPQYDQFSTENIVQAAIHEVTNRRDY